MGRSPLLRRPRGEVGRRRGLGHNNTSTNAAPPVAQVTFRQVLPHSAGLEAADPIVVGASGKEPRRATSCAHVRPGGAARSTKSLPSFSLGACLAREARSCRGAGPLGRVPGGRAGSLGQIASSPGDGCGCLVGTPNRRCRRHRSLVGTTMEPMGPAGTRYREPKAVEPHRPAIGVASQEGRPRARPRPGDKSAQRAARGEEPGRQGLRAAEFDGRLEVRLPNLRRPTISPYSPKTTCRRPGGTVAPTGRGALQPSAEFRMWSVEPPSPRVADGCGLPAADKGHLGLDDTVEHCLPGCCLTAAR